MSSSSHLVQPDPPATTSGNEDRERQILAAASDLVAHYGYDKTTIDDIAREAGVSKGAIYLHFKGKDDLFEALLRRELTTYAQRWFELIEADPNGGTIAGLYKNSLYALNSSKLMAAMFRQDTRVLGNFLRRRPNVFRGIRDEHQASHRYVFVKMMQDAGAVRSDLDPRVIAYINGPHRARMAGLDDGLSSDRPPIDELIEGIAAIMDSALTPAGGGNSETRKGDHPADRRGGPPAVRQGGSTGPGARCIVIAVTDLTYTYPRGDTETLHSLSFEVAEREIFGFLGPSGCRQDDDAEHSDRLAAGLRGLRPRDGPRAS